MLTSDVNCLFTPRSEENNGKKTEIIDQPRFHADTHSTSQKCPLISSLTPLFDSTNYLALFRSYQRAIIHCQTFSVARGERNAHFSVLAPRLKSHRHHERNDDPRHGHPRETTANPQQRHRENLNQGRRPKRCLTVGWFATSKESAHNPDEESKKMLNAQNGTFVFKAPITNLHIHK